MTFKLALKPTYEVDVTVNFPIDGGKLHEAKFRARFTRLGQDELDELRKQITERAITDRELVTRVLVGWSGVQDEDGSDIAFSEEARARLLSVHPVQPCLVNAFLASLQSAREKN